MIISTKLFLPAILLSAVVIIIKPIVVMASLGMLRYTKLTSFKAAIHLSQISEFSIVLVVFASMSGLMESEATSVITLVALITIALSSYLMKYDDELYRKWQNFLGVFERRSVVERKQKQGLYTAILFGYHHGGHEFLNLFREMKERYLVVDHNPEVIEHLEVGGVRHAYGDATDTEFLDEVNAGHAKFVASTILDVDVNLMILGYLHRYSKDIVFVCHAHTYEEALKLYEHGAAYVILPRFLGSDYVTKHIKKHGLGQEAFAQFRERHIVSIGKHAVEIGS